MTQLRYSRLQARRRRIASDISTETSRSRRTEWVIYFSCITINEFEN